MHLQRTLHQPSSGFQSFNHKLHSAAKRNPIPQTTRSSLWIWFPPHHNGVQDCLDISYLNNTYQGHQLPLQSRVQVLTLGSNAWRISVSPRCKLEQGSSEALVNGNLHWVTTRHKHRPGPCLRIVCFDLAEEKFREIESPGCGSINNCNFHLVVLGGCLSAVVCHDDGKIDIWIMKEYGSKESWTREYVIGESLFRSLSERRNSRPSSRIWKRPTLSKGKIQVLCSLRNGEILLEYENGVLVSYNTESEEFQQLMIHGLPKWFCTMVLYMGYLIIWSHIVKVKFCISFPTLHSNSHLNCLYSSHPQKNIEFKPIQNSATF